jgi:hypothetical protein
VRRQSSSPRRREDVSLLRLFKVENREETDRQRQTETERDRDREKETD